MINKEILIFVEGPSDRFFLEVYLLYLYFQEKFPIKNFKVQNVDGKDNLSKRLLELKLKNTIKHLSFLIRIKTMRVIKKRF